MYLIKKLSSLTCALLLSVFGAAYAQQSVAQYVDPFIGTENSGNVFPGASLPFGMVRLSPDCKVISGKSPNTNSGYVSGSSVYGFSHTHVSGTGGGAKYGNILFIPTTGPVDIKEHASPISNETALAGYYSVQLNRYDVKVELTTTHSVGIHRYTFPKSAQANILIDAGAFLIKGSTVQKLVNSGVKVISDTEVEGFETVSGGWNVGAPYTVYFYAKFNTAANAVQTWRNGQLSNSKDAMPPNDSGISSSGAVLSYKTKSGQQIVAQVGISFISTAKAKQNIEKEAGNKNFDQLKQKASDNWNNLLQRVQVEGTEAHKKMFYTALYHVMLMPSDRTGENPLWQSAEPYYDDYYAIWDTFRASNPLITLIDQKKQENIVRSLINIYEHEGYMPDARSGNYNGLVQGGTNSDMLIADAWVKGLKNIDYAKAYAAMLKNAETEPQNPKKEGREGVDEYKRLGYVPYGISVAGSRTMEYANNDYAIATVAKGLGKIADHEKYLKRASNWQNLWRPVSSHNATALYGLKRRTEHGKTILMYSGVELLRVICMRVIVGRTHYTYRRM
jgi:predicted alpha-1,2-mannosidase